VNRRAPPPRTDRELPLVDGPNIARQVRAQLEALRAHGWSFEIAWQHALEHIDWKGLAGSERQAWEYGLREARGAFEASYQGQPAAPPLEQLARLEQAA
jgi:hypothetical protein